MHVYMPEATWPAQKTLMSKLKHEFIIKGVNTLQQLINYNCYSDEKDKFTFQILLKWIFMIFNVGVWWFWILSNNTLAYSE